jgi:hypothetical protein
LTRRTTEMVAEGIPAMENLVSVYVWLGNHPT